MEELIKRLDNWLRENCAVDYEHLLPGLSEGRIQRLEESLGVTLPDDFKIFYRWKNGEKENSWNFIDNSYLMTAEDIISTSKDLNELLEEEEFELKNWWNKSWIPFMADVGGNHCCLDLAGSFGGKPGQIIDFWHDWEVRTVRHESLYKWLETLVKAFELNLLVYVEHWKSYKPAEGYNALFSEINPGYPIQYNLDK
jgi:cell wall assembly regulator SMI1